jgi:hypothetical protein
MDAYDEPTVIWRLERRGSVAHATVIPGTGQATVSWFFDGTMDRVENYETVELALARADQIRGVLERDGWRDAAR